MLKGIEIPRKTFQGIYVRILYVNHSTSAGAVSGKYALAIASRCRGVTGVDLSPQIIAIAHQMKEDYEIHNVDFYCADWHTLSIKSMGYHNKFDLVFAHMTPAIQSAHTFEKLSAASKNRCVLAKAVLTNAIA